MNSCRQLEVHLEDPIQHKWCVPLKEDTFASFMATGSSTVHKVFGDGSLFSPLLFGKFFDPSDAFPLWEFESDVLLYKLRSSSQSTVDWFQTDTDYVLKAELTGLGKDNIQVCVENGKIMEISGQWRDQQQAKTKDWRHSQWWEHGCVRRIELPENSDWREMVASVNNDVLLEIRIAKKPLDFESSQGNDGITKDTEL